jgi:hypothetical protein
MQDFTGKQSRITGPDPAGADLAPSPGKRTLVEALDAPAKLGGEAAAPGLLSPGQAALAVSFYQGQPDLYPPDVIRKIQRAVKAPETGVADAAMAQGVAKFQMETVLKVDGMAGPRTLPRLFESGLATKADRAAFVSTGKATEAAWATLATPEARAAKLFEGVVALLAAEGVPAPTMAVADLGKASGLFESHPWRMSFDRAALAAPTIDDDAARDLSATVYHEARHCEQNHKMARMLATKGNSADQIQAKMGIPRTVADSAVATPLPRGVEFATASQQFDAQYGPGSAHHVQAESEAPSLDELRAAQAAAKADPSPANTAKAARVLRAYQAYHDLPVEADAFATETDYAAAWDEATSAP